MGQTREAIEAYVFRFAAGLWHAVTMAKSEKLADKAIKLEPNNRRSDHQSASYSLQGISPRLRSSWNRWPISIGGDQTELLLDLYLKNSDWTKPRRLRIAYLKQTRKILARCKRSSNRCCSPAMAKKHGNPEKSRLPMIDAGEHEVSGNTQRAAAASRQYRAAGMARELYGAPAIPSFADALAHRATPWGR